MFSANERSFLELALSLFGLTPVHEPLPLDPVLRNSLIKSSLDKLDHYNLFTTFTPQEATVMIGAMIDLHSQPKHDKVKRKFLSIAEETALLDKLYVLAGEKNPPSGNSV